MGLKNTRMGLKMDPLCNIFNMYIYESISIYVRTYMEVLFRICMSIYGRVLLYMEGNSVYERAYIGSMSRFCAM